jgi:hypothetical protein
MTCSTTVTLYKGGIEFNVFVEFFPGTPGFTTGAPEDCYPDEPAELESYEVLSISLKKPALFNADDLAGGEEEFGEELLALALAENE